ncbi:putative mmr1 hsr1 gtp binding protein [Blattamonas nauphoetae]|uniref:Guanine nucleotide-binding protein-like 1 n=1 Tax=Blattamonas nauphoetae TaxID=2049346 RepID=A0ABQ9X862_9EUKA|nr:putative mmr1 hsr1 gtp binding protein [Blattamonas nauphoetae]
MGKFGRAVAFSGKKKNKQIKDRRARKRAEWDPNKPEVKKNITQFLQRSMPEFGGRSLRSVFFAEDRKDTDLRKQQNTIPFEVVNPDGSILKQQKCRYRHLPLPFRPAWDYSFTKQQLEASEREYYTRWLIQTVTTDRPEDVLAEVARAEAAARAIEQAKEEESQPAPKSAKKDVPNDPTVPAEPHFRPVGLFEGNLEVWREFWRSLEMGDVICLLCDVRFTYLHLNPLLVEFITGHRVGVDTDTSRPLTPEEVGQRAFEHTQPLNKGLVIVLTKIDLVPVQVVTAWRDWIHKHFPSVTVFLHAGKGEGAGDSVWLNAEQHGTVKGGSIDDLLTACLDMAMQKQAAPVVATAEKPYTCTVSFIGEPNVGKSNLMNQVVGKSVTSVGRQPGHTKHIQTYLVRPGAVAPQPVAEEDEESEEEIESSSDDDQKHKRGRKGRRNRRGKRAGDSKRSKERVVEEEGRPKNVRPAPAKDDINLDEGPIIRIVDSPGLIWLVACDAPEEVSVLRAIQVLAGLFPFSQVREPYSVIRLATSFLPLTSILHAYQITPAELQEEETREKEEKRGRYQQTDHGRYEWIQSGEPMPAPAAPSDDGQEMLSGCGTRLWDEAEHLTRQRLSPYAIARIFAVRWNFYTQAARPDIHRSSTLLLSMLVSGEGKGKEVNVDKRNTHRRLRGGKKEEGEDEQKHQPPRRESENDDEIEAKDEDSEGTSTEDEEEDDENASEGSEENPTPADLQALSVDPNDVKYRQQVPMWSIPPK